MSRGDFGMAGRKADAQPKAELVNFMNRFGYVTKSYLGVPVQVSVFE